jgi:hypothetical protein
MKEIWLGHVAFVIRTKRKKKRGKEKKKKNASHHYVSNAQVLPPRPNKQTSRE